MKIRTITISLGEQLVGYLTHYHDGKNIFIFDQQYIDLGVLRPTLSLSFSDLDDEAITKKRLEKTYVTMHSLPAFFSNLLPEGSLKEYILDLLKIHHNDEFNLLMALKNDLPGNIIIKEVEALNIGDLRSDSPTTLIKPLNEEDDIIRFSLAGIQMKFSMKKTDKRFNLSRPGAWGDYIIKTPSTVHKQLPQTEYSSMKLAEAAGVTIPEIELVRLDSLDHLPSINLPNEKYAYAIKRFDRTSNQRRIHIEDFAQVLGLRSHHKYGGTNYDTLARIIYNYSSQPIVDIKEMITRLTTNILLGNTDAHIKNFSLIYLNGIAPKLSPAYDIVSSLSYITNREAGLNMGGSKYLYDLDHNTIKKFIRNTKLPEDLVHLAINETIQRIQSTWPKLLSELPITSVNLETMKTHFEKLKAPFTFRM